MTQEEIDELLKAKDENLEKEYLVDDYVYLINENGTPGDFTGFKNNINKGKNGKSLGVPYKVCRVHTKELLDKQNAAAKPTLPSVTAPGTPAIPGAPANPNAGNVTPVG